MLCSLRLKPLCWGSCSAHALSLAAGTWGQHEGGVLLWEFGCFPPLSSVPRWQPSLTCRGHVHCVAGVADVAASKGHQSELVEGVLRKDTGP